MEKQEQLVEEAVSAPAAVPAVVDVSNGYKPKDAKLQFWKAVHIKYDATHEGVFVVKRLNLGEQIKRDLRVARLDRAAGISDAEARLPEVKDGEALSLTQEQNAHQMHLAIATLQFAVVEHPEWWPQDPAEVPSYDMLTSVYMEVVNFYGSFR